MNSLVRNILVAVCFCACSFSCAVNEQSSVSAREVVSDFFEHLEAGDIDSLDPLFYSIPEMEDNRADWLALLEKMSRKVADEQLEWEVVCGKELPEIAAVIVNQTMKLGKKHGDPDAVYLVLEQGRWLLLPDIFANNAKDAVLSTLNEQQLQNHATLRQWAVSEIRGITTDCSR